jgi:RimJ/RimL family protein N-acetyltransferase
MAVDGGRMETKWMHFCFDYVFNQLKVHKLIGIVASDNIKALRLDKHFGYIEEAVLKGCSKNGADMHLLTMTRDQCRVLNK